MNNLKTHSHFTPEQKRAGCIANYLLQLKMNDNTTAAVDVMPANFIKSGKDRALYLNLLSKLFAFFYNYLCLLVPLNSSHYTVRCCI